MADQASIFGDNNQQGTPPVNNEGGGAPLNAQLDNSFADLLGNIKNERGEPKYKTVQDALNGLIHAQSHIQTLTAEQRARDEEIAKLRGDVSKVESLEQAVQALIQKQGEQGQPANVPTETDIANLVTRTLELKQTEAQQAANIRAVVEAVKKTHGEKAAEVFYARGAEIGLNQAELNALAGKSPKAVLTMLGISANAPTNSGSPNSGTINADGFRPRQDSFVGRNSRPFVLGASNDDRKSEIQASRNMIKELEDQGMSINDLTNPKVYKKLFNKK